MDSRRTEIPELRQHIVEPRREDTERFGRTEYSESWVALGPEHPPIRLQSFAVARFDQELLTRFGNPHPGDGDVRAEHTQQGGRDRQRPDQRRARLLIELSPGDDADDGQPASVHDW
jgi:hypothetical protein